MIPRGLRRAAAPVVSVLALAGCGAGGGGEPVAAGDLPNVVVVLTDDQRFDSVDQMPLVDGRRDWARFENAFVELPQCCPSRATFLTGQYAHHTGVETLRDGEDLDESSTVATMLDDAGYHTAFIGKYLNGFPFGDPYVPPGWDRFAGYRGGTHYFDYALVEDGAEVVEHGSEPEDYSTDVFARMALDFVRDVDPSEPFFLYLAPNAPHGDRPSGLPVPAPRHATACADRPFEPRPSFDATDTREPIPWLSRLGPVDPGRMTTVHTATCRALQAVDEAVDALLAELEATGRLDDTYVVYTSDNGYSFGEHRLVAKGHLYDESVRVPLLVRGPGVRPGPLDRLTSNVDLAPTIAEWAGIEVPAGTFDGTSFAGALRGEPGEGPEQVLLRGCRTQRAPGDATEEEADEQQACGGHSDAMPDAWGVRTRTHKYVEYEDGSVQLFDLAHDPYELTNLASDPNAAAVVADLRARLERLRGS
ncbi:MAG: hypothetical protein KatS3mg009_1795 [Acidimicrobiia bacterium]|nr:MAG: hypothetical protein KatS3mg009_1795 [Acidimicrobiia bacterium]